MLLNFQKDIMYTTLEGRSGLHDIMKIDLKSSQKLIITKLLFTVQSSWIGKK